MCPCVWGKGGGAFEVTCEDTHAIGGLKGQIFRVRGGVVLGSWEPQPRIHVAFAGDEASDGGGTQGSFCCPRHPSPPTLGTVTISCVLLSTLLSSFSAPVPFALIRSGNIFVRLKKKGGI